VLAIDINLDAISALQKKLGAQLIPTQCTKIAAKKGDFGVS
jgi:hypothetical protein